MGTGNRENAEIGGKSWPKSVTRATQLGANTSSNGHGSAIGRLKASAVSIAGSRGLIETGFIAMLVLRDCVKERSKQTGNRGSNGRARGDVNAARSRCIQKLMLETKCVFHAV